MDQINPKEHKPEKADCGILYIVATPVGNLEDMTYRAIRVLQEADLIAAESSAHSRRLCAHYHIRTRLTSYNQHNHKVKAQEILKELHGGRRVALITCAGTPGISDPGTLLAHQAWEQGMQVVPIPGSSAVIAALSAAGLRSDCFYFGGFLSPRAGKRKKELQTLAALPWTLVFYEAPHRLAALLADILSVMGDRTAVIWREMTKIHEEALRGPLSELLQQIRARDLKGEITLVLAGAGDESLKDRFGEEDLARRITEMLEKEHKGVKEIASGLAREKSLAYRRVYKLALALKKS